MYEAPRLIPVGNAENVILGLANSGWDLDGLFIVQTMEFADEIQSQPAEL